MVLGIAEDFTSSITLDSELLSIPSNGIYLNRGVHPSITIENLLSFLPNTDLTLTAYNSATTYGRYTTTNNKKDLVTSGGKIYQSLQSSNLNNTPSTSTSYWLETNLESLRLKSFLDKVKDRVYSDLSLSNRLITNQKIYESGLPKTEQLLPNDYCGWVFQPKGSDYTSIRINQVSIEKSGTTPINLYVINQGVLKDTLTITPSNGIVDFKDLNYTFKGEGEWYFVIDSTTVKTNGSVIDPLKYDGFVVYTTTGNGNAPESASYNIGVSGNGLGFNVTAFLDANVYINNNLNEFGNLIRSTFELMSFEMFYHNSNNRSNRAQKIQMNDELLRINLFDLEADTVAKRRKDALKDAKIQLSKTFDTQLYNDNKDGLTIETSAL